MNDFLLDELRVTLEQKQAEARRARQIAMEALRIAHEKTEEVEKFALWAQADDS
jgi:hypothetical protein